MDDLLLDAGAVLQPGFAGLTAPEWVRRAIGERALGGVALYGRNVRDATQVAALTEELYALNPEILVATDEEGGDVTRLETGSGSSYPGNMALGAVDDTALTEAVARSIGRDLAGVGIGLDYAPDADVNSNPDNPVIGVRSFGGDADLVARHTAAYVRGLQSAGVAACAKHFPGHGDTAVDSHLGLPRIELDEQSFTEHLRPFRAAIAAGARAVMTAHILFPEYDPELPATMSRRILTGLLREEFGFDGLVVTDGIEMAAISGTHGVAAGAVRAIASGADTICVGGGLRDEDAYRYLRDALVWAVREGRLTEERLHEAAERNRAVAAWARKGRETPRAAGAPSGADGGADGDGRVIGLTAARRALRLDGELTPLQGVPHVLEFTPVANIAVGDETSWGVAGPLAELVPGTTMTRVAGPPGGGAATRVDIGPLLGAAVGRPLVAVVRDVHRYGWMRRAVLEITDRRPDTVVVEVGTGHGLRELFAARGTTVLATRGSARVCGVAAAEALTGRRRPDDS
jgi:beta-N-acetylhexosaminidase